MGLQVSLSVCTQDINSLCQNLSDLLQFRINAATEKGHYVYWCDCIIFRECACRLILEKKATLEVCTSNLLVASDLIYCVNISE